MIYKIYMQLRNNKIIKFHYIKKINKKNVLNQSVEKLPPELLNIISSFCFCNFCHNNNYKHCNYCNAHNINKKLHLTCKKCNLCYPKHITIYANSILYNDVVIHHIHCESCNNVKKYSMTFFMYYCPICS